MKFVMHELGHQLGTTHKKVISFPVYFESTRRNEMERVTDKIHFLIGNLNDFPYRGEKVIRN